MWKDVSAAGLIGSFVGVLVLFVASPAYAVVDLQPLADRLDVGIADIIVIGGLLLTQAAGFLIAFTLVRKIDKPI